MKKRFKIEKISESTGNIVNIDGYSTECLFYSYAVIDTYHIDHDPNSSEPVITARQDIGWSQYNSPRVVSKIITLRVDPHVNHLGFLIDLFIKSNSLNKTHDLYLQEIFDYCEINPHSSLLLI